MSVPKSQDLPDVLRSVRARPLFQLHERVPPLYVVGQTPNAFRRIGVITGGSFEGERLSGEVVSGGNDWQDVRKDNCTKLDVRLLLQDGGRRSDRDDLSSSAPWAARSDGGARSRRDGRSGELLFPPERPV
jgi:hypothetical protein